jgi:spore coat protein A, manganese oxidase
MSIHWFKAARKRRYVTRPLRIPLLAATVSCAVVGTGALISAGPLASAAQAAGECGPSPTATFFTDPVAQPPVAAPDGPGHYTLTAHLGTHQFSSGWPAVPTLGYSTANAKVDYLGPTIVTKKGQPVDVTLVNGLPASGTKMFPFDQPNDDNAVVLHRHGGLQAAASDGAPGQEILPGGSRTNHYPNDQAAAPLWYHDHADHVTSYNVYEGLAGFMPNTDNLEPLFNLPGGSFAKAYVLQDKSFNADHTLCYTHAAPEFFGDLPVVNGTIAPFQQVEPRRYTFTFINGSDSRFYHLTLQQTGGAAGASAPAMTVVASDSGYILHPARVNDLLISPGERYKMVVDFTGHAGQNWGLANDAATPFPDGDDSVAKIPQLMSFQVSSPLSSTDRSSVPPVIVETNNLIPPSVSLLTARLRTVQAGESSPGVAQLGDAVQLRAFTDPPTETPQLGSTEAWAMRNHSPDTHPIHVHLVELRLVGRWHVGQWDANGNPVPSTIGPFQPPGAWESGPKDTFVAPKDTITVWVGKYTIGGTSVWHCHILSHEDSAIQEMMRPLVVGNTPQTQLPLIITQARLDTLIRQPVAR